MATKAATTHWVIGDDERCTCLTRDDHGLRHATRCTVITEEADPEWPRVGDNSDIRELAEIAAKSDIDTALAILRAWMARGAL